MNFPKHVNPLPLSLRRRAAYKAFSQILEYDLLMRAMWMLEERDPHADRLTFLGMVSAVAQIFNIDNQSVSKIMLDTNRYLSAAETELPPDPLSDMRRYINADADSPTSQNTSTYSLTGTWEETLTHADITRLCNSLSSHLTSQESQHLIIAKSSQHIDDAIIKPITEQLHPHCSIFNAGLLPQPIYNFCIKNAPGSQGIYLAHSPLHPQQLSLSVTLAGDLQAFSNTNLVLPNPPQTTHKAERGSIKFSPLYIDDYLAALFENIFPLRPFFVALLSPNQLVLEVATEILSEFGCKIHLLNPRENNINMPGDKRDPVNAQLNELCNFVALKNADIGFYFNNDCSSLRVINKKGELLSHFDVFSQICGALNHDRSLRFMFDATWQPLLDAIDFGDKQNFIANPAQILQPSVLHTENIHFAANELGHFHFTDRWHGHNDVFYCAARILETLSESTLNTSTPFSKIFQ